MMIRLQDIAEMAGVSRTTVSNVINGNTKSVSGGGQRLIKSRQSLKNRTMFLIWDPSCYPVMAPES